MSTPDGDPTGPIPTPPAYAYPAPGQDRSAPPNQGYGYAYPAPGQEGAPQPGYGTGYGYGYGYGYPNGNGTGPGYPPGYAGYPPGYPPNTAQPWGYQRPPAPGYGGPGYPTGAIPGQSKPGIIPLRPLTLSDIFNGAVGFIRGNPKATLGLTAMVVVILQIVSLLARLYPLVAADTLRNDPSYRLNGSDLGAWALSEGVGAVITWLGGILLSGMLTVVVGRAVFGAPITIGEAWAKVRGRLPALLGLALLQVVGLVAILGLSAVLLVLAGVVADGAGVAIALLLLVPAGGVLLVYLYIGLQFAPVLIVLERLPVVDAIPRSFALVRNSFWRVLGILLLAELAVTLVSGAAASPFSIAGAVLALNASSTMLLVGATLTAIGAAISQIITAPFSAGVVVLLYTDRRMRSEAFDLVLQSGAANGPAAAMSTDNLWLTRNF